MQNINNNPETAQFTDKRIKIQELINDLESTVIHRKTELAMFSPKLDQAIIKLIEAKMWLGMHIGTIEGVKSLDISNK